MARELTNGEFARQDKLFIKACELAAAAGHKVVPSERQASKFRNERGIAHKFKGAAQAALAGKREE